ncbi:MAG: DUF2786 domain-containing protein [Myxococcales bacterium FL481]|nr:MAG: DUF2786 domain-containing protein [Myxococcales bacterium FL481]
MDDKLLERVRKLLRLATSDNVHEAANAAARAQELIDRHRIDALTRANLSRDPFDDTTVVEAIDEPLECSKRLRKWKVFLATSLAPTQNCRVYVLEPRPPDKQQRLVPVGDPTDIAILAELYRFCVTQIECLTRAHGEGQDRKWREGFRVGAAKTVVARLQAARQQTLDRAPDLPTPAPSESADPADGALAHPERLWARRLAEVDAHLRAKSGLRSGKSLRVHAQSFTLGEQAGHRVDLPSRE